MGALDGIRVIDAGVLVQAPQAAATMLAWGAEVVKIELPGFGDTSRWIPVAQGDPRSAYFIASNRGKKSVTMDLRTESGREVFLRLVERSDVIVSNFTPGTMEKWRLGYDEVAARNPRIIWASGSTFGSLGADADREGADLSAQAAGGLISRTGIDGSEMTPVAATIADHIASQNLVAGVLAALLARERTGRGQRVDTSLLGGQIWAQASEYTSYLLSDQVPGRANRGNPMIPNLYGMFATADGWLAIVGVVGKARVEFYDVIGEPGLEDEFPDLFYFDAEKANVFPRIAEALAKKTTAEWCVLLTRARIRHAPVRSFDEVVADPGAWENGYFATVPSSEAADAARAVVAPPVRFSDTPSVVPAHVPELGQHTEEVLTELGYSLEEIGRLTGEGAV